MDKKIILVILIISYVITCNAQSDIKRILNNMDEYNKIRNDIGLMILDKSYFSYIENYPFWKISKDNPESTKEGWNIIDYKAFKMVYRDKKNKILYETDYYSSGRNCTSPDPDSSKDQPEKLSVMYNYAKDIYSISYIVYSADTLHRFRFILYSNLLLKYLSIIKYYV